MGEIVDLKSAGEAEKAQPSTGAVEARNVIVRGVTNNTAIVTQSTWSAIKSLQDEAQILFHNFVGTIDNKTNSSPVASKSDSVNIHGQTTKSLGESTSSQPTNPRLAHADRIVQQLTSAVSSSEAYTDAQVASFQKDTPEVIAMFKEVMGSQCWNDVKQLFKAYLRVEDTGGQPELMDMLPALTIGPGLYLLFINLQNDLDDHYKLTYCSSSGASTPQVESNFSVKEMLLSSLSSISCSNASSTMSSLNKEATIIPNVSDILKSSKSVAFIVGTHKDKVSKERITKMNQELQQVIESTEFSDFVEYFSEDELIVTMDNMNGGTEEVRKIQTLLEKGMNRHFKELKVPAVWLLFSLILRKKSTRTATLTDCMHLSEALRMSSYETEVALWFLHHHAGVIMYFPNIPELKDLVILDNQVVYDSVTILILRAMSFEEVGHKDSQYFKKTGKFVPSHIKSVTCQDSKDFIPLHKLVALLEFLHIIAQISVHPYSSSLHMSNEDVTYIMPCVLNNASREELGSISKERRVVCPIMIYFKCGFVPIGIFPAMIACLTNNKSFTLIEEKILKNVVQFRYGPHRTLLTLLCHSTYYEVIISEFVTSAIEPHKECAAIRKEIELAFEVIRNRVNYGSFMEYQFAFHCPLHSENGRNHLCVVNRTEITPVLMDCLDNPRNPTPLELSDQHKLWFGQVCRFFINMFAV